MATYDELLQILDDHSTKRFYMKYNGSLANHFAHGLIALYKLGATKSRLHEFGSWYSRTHNLETSTAHGYVSHKPSEKQILEPEKLQRILGSDTDYYVLVDHYEALINKTYNGSLLDFIRGEYPNISRSLHVSLLHAVIQIGYGFSVKSSRAVAEGFAYQGLDHFIPVLDISPEYIYSTLAKQSMSSLEVLDAIHNDTKLHDLLVKACPNVENSGKFRMYLKASIENQAVRSVMLQYADAIQFPVWFPESNPAMVDVMKLSDWLIDTAITIYACAECKNDFVLLHGVTASWSLQQILSCFDKTEDAVKCIRSFLTFLVSLYVSLNHPKIDLSCLQNDAIANQNLRDYPELVLSMTIDEHVYKLVQVCCEMGEKYEAKDKQMLYKVACRAAMDKRSQYFIY